MIYIWRSVKTRICENKSTSIFLQQENDQMKELCNRILYIPFSLSAKECIKAVFFLLAIHMLSLKNKILKE